MKKIFFGKKESPRGLARFFKLAQVLKTGGVNGRGTVGYIGPKPPIGTHRYFFKVFAVDTVLSFNEPPELKDVFNAIDGRVVQMAETMGTYKLQF